MRTLAACWELDIPVTPRGGGSGNYGQAMPLAGGVVLDMMSLNHIRSIDAGTVVVEPGARLSAIESWIEIGRSVCRARIRKFVIVNSHGGNSALITVVAHELRKNTTCSRSQQANRVSETGKPFMTTIRPSQIFMADSARRRSCWRFDLIW